MINSTVDCDSAQGEVKNCAVICDSVQDEMIYNAKGPWIIKVGNDLKYWIEGEVICFYKFTFMHGGKEEGSKCCFI